ncbi:MULTISPECIES: hypothetical protein [unclassified Serratia (in: enterobacteria)]|uniref:hypothetical protein n=1 Tax=unclassified Serratia (in: enterobacteria) TaxID=2647522 RepID=UPI002118CABA|nr:MULTISPECIES: hypothetical protein [unclassified Serratia (in: enterobacteria)]
MNKMNIGFLIFFIIILGCAALYLNYPSEKPFRCNAHVSTYFTSKDGKKLVLNLDLNVITAREGRSEVLAVGSVTGLDKDYVIARRIFISMKESDFKNLSKTLVTREERHPIDNLPEEIWREYVLPEAPGVAFYAEAKKIRENLYLIKGLTNPYFICTLSPR